MSEDEKKEIVVIVDITESQILGILDQFASEEKGNRLSSFSLMALRAIQETKLKKLKAQIEELLNKE